MRVSLGSKERMDSEFTDHIDTLLLGWCGRDLLRLTLTWFGHGDDRISTRSEIARAVRHRDRRIDRTVKR